MRVKKEVKLQSKQDIEELGVALSSTLMMAGFNKEQQEKVKVLKEKISKVLEGLKTHIDDIDFIDLDARLGHNNNMYFLKLVNEFKNLLDVEAIALGGSRVSSHFDQKSDYDLYVYVKNIPPRDVREKILNKYCRYLELSNSYWELEDDCTFKDGIDIDIIYRNIDEFAKSIAMVVKDNVAFNGYTTCMWHNLKTCQILFDREGRLTLLKNKYDIPYPTKLKENIIKKNMSLLTGFLPSYDKQILKALNRHDFVSVNHRLAAFIESYFDVIFALNELSHPGEKRMLTYALEFCLILPKNFQENIDLLLQSAFTNKEVFIKTLEEVIHQLEEVVK